MELQELTAYLNSYLRIDEISDYGPQGLQIETDNRLVEKVALAVDSSPEIIEAAAKWNADLLLVHHGIFWGGAQNISGPFGERVRSCMRSGVNLYAAHLPLDAHREVGNNAILARLVGLENLEDWGKVKGTFLGLCGDVQPQLISNLVAKLDQELKTTSRILNHGPNTIRRVAVMSGGGAGMVAEAVAAGADTYITGETSHSHFWLASDYKINVIFSGHYATETVGVKALGKHLAESFSLKTKFFDYPTQM